jgi:hypothetical protein
LGLVLHFFTSSTIIRVYYFNELRLVLII